MAAQDREGAYEVDLAPQPGEMRFARGEVLGFSGASGAGPPHLHAEIRTGPEASIAVNPAGAVVDRSRRAMRPAPHLRPG